MVDLELSKLPHDVTPGKHMIRALCLETLAEEEIDTSSHGQLKLGFGWSTAPNITPKVLSGQM